MAFRRWASSPLIHARLNAAEAFFIQDLVTRLTHSFRELAEEVAVWIELAGLASNVLEVQSEMTDRLVCCCTGA